MLFLLTAVILLVADLGIKAWSFANVAGVPVSLARDEQGRLEPVPLHESTVIIPKVLSLHLTANEGAVFGLGQGGRWIFIVVSIVAVSVIGRLFWTSRPGAVLQHLALASILAGALGNLYDRILFAAVRDMFWLFPGVKLPFGWKYPQFLGGGDDLYPWIFNLADAALLVGVLMMFIVILKSSKHEKKQTKEASES